MKASVKYEIAFAILCVICVSVFFVSAAITAEISGRDEPQRIAQTPAAAEPEREEAAYILREYGGRVYVYAAGEPFMLTDIEPEHLPAADREKLREGIGAADREVLLSLIEDFGS